MQVEVVVVIFVSDLEYGLELAKDVEKELGVEVHVVLGTSRDWEWWAII